MTDEQKQVFAGKKLLPWLHLNTPTGNTSTTYCADLKLTKTTHTPKTFFDEESGICEFGEPLRAYQFDGDATIYGTLEQVADVILARAKIIK